VKFRDRLYQRAVGAGKKHGWRSDGCAQPERLAARIERYAAQPPVAQQRCCQAFVEECLALAKRHFPDPVVMLALIVEFLLDVSAAMVS